MQNGFCHFIPLVSFIATSRIILFLAIAWQFLFPREFRWKLCAFWEPKIIPAADSQHCWQSAELNLACGWPRSQHPLPRDLSRTPQKLQTGVSEEKFVNWNESKKNHSAFLFYFIASGNATNSMFFQVFSKIQQGTFPFVSNKCEHVNTSVRFLGPLPQRQVWKNAKDRKRLSQMQGKKSHIAW